MSVDECMTRVTLREFKVWRYRILREVDTLTPTTFYLLRILRELRRLYKAETGEKTPTSDDDVAIHSPYFVPEKKPSDSFVGMTRQQISAKIAPVKAVWAGFFKSASKKLKDKKKK